MPARNLKTLTLPGKRGGRGRTEKPRPYLYQLLDASRPLQTSVRHELTEVDEVLFGRDAQRRWERDTEGGVRRLTLVSEDAGMSTRHGRLVRQMGRWVFEDLGSKNGSRVNGRDERRVLLAPGDLIELGNCFLLFSHGTPPPLTESEDISAAELKSSFPGMDTLIPSFSDELAALAEVARTPLHVLIEGESGTGKERIARGVHALSERRGTFYAVTCGTLLESKLEAELFGSGERPGAFRAADGGTLCLDEVGDLAAPAQAALLRAVEEQEVRPQGAVQTVPVNVRVVSTSNRSLQALTTSKAFRADLFARLSGFVLRLPPLRERREDLGLLIAALTRKVAGDRSGEVRFTPDGARALLCHAWPMNVRELEQAIASALPIARGGAIDVMHLPPVVRPAASGAPPEDLSDEASGESSAEDAQLRQELIALLREHGGNVSMVSKAMGKARMQISRWMKRFRIDPNDYRA
jgi:transcriptional regulator with AAA-type ATPase domain